MTRLIPADFRNDALTRSIIEANAASRAQYSKPREVLFTVQDPRWAEQMEAARWFDAYAVGHHGQRDRCHSFCAMQAQQQRDGFRMVEVSTNIYGFVVRDTMNDGEGVLFGGRAKPGTTQAEAVEWARQWHAERPTHREVIAGYGYVVRMEAASAAVQ